MIFHELYILQKRRHRGDCGDGQISVGVGCCDGLCPVILVRSVVVVVVVVGVDAVVVDVVVVVVVVGDFGAAGVMMG